MSTTGRQRQKTPRMVFVLCVQFENHEGETKIKRSFVDVMFEHQFRIKQKQLENTFSEGMTAYDLDDQEDDITHDVLKDFLHDAKIAGIPQEAISLVMNRSANPKVKAFLEELVSTNSLNDWLEQ